jgi:hypothetical protein
MYTINDFSAYVMILGWTIHEKLVSPYYMKTIKPSP